MLISIARPLTLFLEIHPPLLCLLPLVPIKGNYPTTAFSAVDLVSDQDFSLRKTFHIINSLPPPAAEFV